MFLSILHLLSPFMRASDHFVWEPMFVRNINTCTLNLHAPECDLFISHRHLLPLIFFFRAYPCCWIRVTERAELFLYHFFFFYNLNLKFLSYHYFYFMYLARISMQSPPFILKNWTHFTTTTFHLSGLLPDKYWHFSCLPSRYRRLPLYLDLLALSLPNGKCYFFHFSNLLFALWVIQI